MTVAGETTYNILESHYVCPECGCISDEHTMKKAPAKWIANNPTAYQQGERSFWITAFVSQWVSWNKTIKEFLDAKSDSKALQVVVNTGFGELWEDRGNLENEDELLARRETYEAELPNGVLVLTAGIDTQDDRMEYEIVGHGYSGETWGIEKGVVMGRPDNVNTWDELDRLVFDRVLRFSDGIGLRMSMSFVDEGGHFTQDVREQCRKRLAKNVFCIKGMAGLSRPFVPPPKEVKIYSAEKIIGTCWQYQLGVDSGKQIIMDNLRVDVQGDNYCHFPRRDDYSFTYFKGLLSERLTYKEGTGQWKWEKIPGHERNEALDCRNYALAAFRAANTSPAAAERMLRQARGQDIPHRNVPIKKKKTHHKGSESAFNAW